MNNLKSPQPFLFILFCLFATMNTNASALFSKLHGKTDSIKTHKTPILLFNAKSMNSVLAVAPILTATGNQMYCPSSLINIVTSMSIVNDPTETGTNAIYIQISSGYVSGQDLLSLTGTHPNVVATWDQSVGKLTLRSPSGGIVAYTDFVNAIEDVVFSNSSATPSGTRTFSITVGQANYLPSNGHYYQYIPSEGITWTSAKTLAESSTYYGLQGYLATLTAADEAQLAGAQASGTGWIAGTDRDTEGVWKWASGPENGEIFWNGGPNGSTPSFAFWNNGEPNDSNNEDYAHITAPGVGIPGSWNDLPVAGSNGSYVPKGYIVEYGSMPGDPVLQISTSTTIYIPKINSTTSGSHCGVGTVTLNATASGGTITWYDVPTGGTPLGTGNTFTTPSIATTTSYYVDAFNNQCPTSSRTEVIATIIEIPNITSTTPNSRCGEGNITLQATTSAGTIRWYASATSTNPIGNGISFNTPSISSTTTFYAEAVNNNDCTSGIRTAVIATVYAVPDIDDVQIPLCENSQVTLNAGVTGVTYLWSTSETSQTIIAGNPGNYTVEMTTPDGCPFSRTFTISQILAPTISTVDVNGTTITIKTTNPGDFEYSIDGVNYQDSNVFTEVSSGLHTAFVRNNCDGDSQQFVVVIVPTFFSPNQDSFNDFWRVEGMTFYPEAKVAIFDRYGKLITQLSPSNPVWDGNLNGKSLPATDYWYVLTINNSFPEVKGHFSLIR